MAATNQPRAPRTPRNIKTMQIVRMPAMNLRPGHVLAEGLVLEVRLEGKTLFIDMPLGTSWVDKDGEVQVIANIGQEAAKAAKDTLAEQEKGSRR